MAQNLRLVRSRAGPVPIALRRSGSSNSGSLASGWLSNGCPTYVPLKPSASAPIFEETRKWDGPLFCLVSWCEAKISKMDRNGWFSMEWPMFKTFRQCPAWPSMQSEVRRWFLSVTVRERPLRFVGRSSQFSHVSTRWNALDCHFDAIKIQDVWNKSVKILTSSTGEAIEIEYHSIS